MKKKINKPTTQEWVQFTKQQKMDWVMDNELMDVIYFQSNFSIQDGRDYIKRQLDSMQKKTSTKCDCPCCGKSQGFQVHSLNDGILEFAYALSELSYQALDKFNLNRSIKLKKIDIITAMPSFHYNKEVLAFIEKETGRRPTGFTMLKHWGLIEEDSSQRNPIILGRGKFNGYWYLTEKGVRFINNEFQLPLEVHAYNNEVHHFGDKLVYSKDCGTITYVDRQKYRTTYF